MSNSIKFIIIDKKFNTPITVTATYRLVKEVDAVYGATIDLTGLSGTWSVNNVPILSGSFDDLFDGNERAELENIARARAWDDYVARIIDGQKKLAPAPATPVSPEAVDPPRKEVPQNIGAWKPAQRRHISADSAE